MLSGLPLSNEPLIYFSAPVFFVQTYFMSSHIVVDMALSPFYWHSKRYWDPGVNLIKHTILSHHHDVVEKWINPFKNSGSKSYDSYLFKYWTEESGMYIYGQLYHFKQSTKSENHIEFCPELIFYKDIFIVYTNTKPRQQNNGELLWREWNMYFSYSR